MVRENVTDHIIQSVISKTKELHYIPTPSGNIAVHIKYNGEHDTTYFLLKDHLGSIIKIINTDGTTVEENNYDPWGKLRNSNDCSFDNVNTNLLTGRGFTGHEHLPEFQLINMNGRMYDPVIGRVLSPDNFVQDPNNAQNYNRYSYCLNNPLRYTDPTGMLINPIYDFEGNFLGTDDRGLQGEAILMNREYFTQGMSHDDAVWRGKLFSQLDNYERWNFMEKGYSHWQSLSDRPDWDGFVTIDEGIA